MIGLDMLRKGDFNTMEQREISPGVTEIRMHKRGQADVTTIKVRDLYGPKEKLLETVVLQVMER